MKSTLSADRTVLMIDHDVQYCRLLGAYLAPHGFDVAWTCEGAGAAERVRASPPAGVILDVWLKDADGFEVLSHIRSFSSIPILMLTARADEADRVRGLESGADDYISKTSSPREVLARLRALMRRSRITTLDGEGLVLGELRIDFRGRSVQLAGIPVGLTQVEFDLLASLARSPGRVCTREHLARASERLAMEGNAINVHISMLRKKLGEDADHPFYIHTVRGMGYKLALPD